ncbi:acyltransferase [Clostridium sporogenes]|uniref:acyltransferase n=2 Tax=Clostridium sporogenes TaxID=1509 RepID=UPI0013D726FB|nr:acyltransferase [Clostridium sporogenes]NFG69738.1 acyltransferase [Clostridium sporogenes]
MKKRIESMDILKSLSTLAVIMIHVSASAINNSQFDTNIYKFSLILNQLSRFSVPVFIFLSGMGLTLSYKKKESYLKYELHRLNKVVPEYLLWSSIYYFFIMERKGLRELLVGCAGGDIYYHLYFVPIIIIFYIMFPLFFNFFKTNLALILSFLVNISFTTFNYLNYNANLPLSMGIETLFNWIFYFILGINIGKKFFNMEAKIKSYRKFITISTVTISFLFILESFYSIIITKDLEHATTFIRPAVIVYSTFFIFFILALDWKDSFFSKMSIFISKHSYIIYLSHPFILYHVKFYFKNNNYAVGSKWFLLITYIMCITGSIIISILRNLVVNIYRSIISNI